MLCLDDLFVLAAPMIQEVQRSLPLPAAVSFCVFAAASLALYAANRKALDAVR